MGAPNLAKSARPWRYRKEVLQRDVEPVRRLVAATGFFNPAEIDIAVELVAERLAKGDGSGYHFICVEAPKETLAAYACFGPIPGTRSSFDLYWIAVDPGLQNQGLGSELLAAAEAKVWAMGGRRLYVETSSRAQYDPTRAFYLRNGYRQAALLEDFYAPGDSKVIFLKVWSPAPQPR